MIPFLRDTKGSPDRIRRENLGRTSRRTRQGKSVGGMRMDRKREMMWNNFSRPISKYNEIVHSSMKISFEKL